MLKFATFNRLLCESIGSSGHIKHLNHPEDGIFDGADGFNAAHHFLHAMHHHLKGKDSYVDNVSTKTDGSVSAVFGHHPVSGKFFVGSKSVFNKDAKLNYTEEDIERNHGHAPGLVHALKQSLKHLPKITGKSGVYQSDLVFTHDTKHHDDKGIHFQPNTITYSVDLNHPDYHHVANAKIGLAAHTKYEGTPESEHNLVGMSAKPFFGKEELRGHKDVHITDNRFKRGDIKVNSDKIDHHLDVAHKIYSTMKIHHMDSVKAHSGMLNTYINKTIRDGSKANLDDYRAHLSEKLSKEVDKVKTEASKAKKQAVHDEAVAHFDNNRDHIAKALQIHSHLQTAKNEMVRAMNNSSHYYRHSFKGQKTNPEGYAVTNKDGETIKLVDREEFSKNNFANSEERFGKK